MTKIIWSRHAQTDLFAILDYIALDNLDAALALQGDIEAASDQLRDFPDQGRPGRVEGTRELIIRTNYIAVYIQSAAGLRILRLLHASRQWP
ncbi:type II toxin-antitoxin system RelE/ParE family toxin [Woodsholea maritima]|uniref:type II toxin-antitoxin system RelE/ParE family toxin n=1 Tax=Woodsholea maritima TaxID=240237 RepID=UPI00035E0772|nr:type II toxin-antitoxin system RelE/ParE family toxin [Woodsholea maritima]